MLPKADPGAGTTDATADDPFRSFAVEVLFSINAH